MKQKPNSQSTGKAKTKFFTKLILSFKQSFQKIKHWNTPDLKLVPYEETVINCNQQAANQDIKEQAMAKDIEQELLCAELEQEQLLKEIDEDLLMLELKLQPHQTYVADFSNSMHCSVMERLKNYTIDGEDPNLRITNLPPSDRLH